ncbi:hypothetical protein [Dactylosporangium maewongense]|uniref:hypothetical protein n=1 Tax=Dactylosporangium maewongense TaxID=634393 RepID=UPI0031DC33D4
MSMIDSLKPLRTRDFAHSPDLGLVRRAVRAADWAAVVAYFDGLPPRADHALAVEVAAEVPGSERFLQRAVDTERDSSLARTLLGSRCVVLGWEARTTSRAANVSQAQWRVFYDHLGRAERLLTDAVAIDPGNAAAWTERIVTARALGFEPAEARRRYDKAAEHCDVPYRAQGRLIQNLAPKWGGSTKAMHDFAQECLKAGPPGTLAGAVVADAHIEHAFTSDRISRIRDYLGQRKVRDQLGAAAARTVLHTDHEPGHGWVAAHSAFAFALFQGGDLPRSARHFAALGNLVRPYGWDMMSDSWKADFRAARSKAAAR